MIELFLYLAFIYLYQYLCINDIFSRQSVIRSIIASHIQNNTLTNMSLSAHLFGDEK